MSSCNASVAGTTQRAHPRELNCAMPRSLWAVERIEDPVLGQFVGFHALVQKLHSNQLGRLRLWLDCLDLPLSSTGDCHGAGMKQ